MPQPIPSIRLTGRFGDNREVTLQLFVEPTSFQPGVHPFHGVETYGVVNAGDVGTAGFAARIGGGSITLAEAAAVPGAPVSGRFEARTYQVGCIWR